MKGTSKSFDKFPADIDEDYRRYFTNELGPLPTSTDCNENGVNNDASDSDTNCEIFLANGNFIVDQANEKTGMSEPFKYDAEDGCDNGLDLGNSKEMKGITVGNVGDDQSKSSSGSMLDSPLVFKSLSKRQRRQLVVEDDMSSEPTDSNPFRNQACSVGELAYGGTSASDRKCKTNMKGEDYSTLILTKSGKVAEEGKPEATVDMKELRDGKYDGDYATLLNHLSFDGGKMVLKYENFMPIVYDEEPDVQIQFPTNAEGSGAKVVGDNNCHYIGTPTSHSLFREQLMRILRKPYDLKEHQMLSQDIAARKPMTHDRDLRNRREQTCAKDKDGKSYLDHYYDLKRKLQAAKTGHDELSLLRGFFFWLQNLTQEGAFKPWLDPSCLALQQWSYKPE